MRDAVQRQVAINKMSASQRDIISELFTQTRVSTNKSISRMVEGSCENLVSEVHLKECRESPAHHKSVDALAAALKRVDLQSREQEFIARHHAEQKAAMECEIKQLRALYNEESVKPFYGTVIEDICQKLPELKVHWDRLQALQSEVKWARSKYESDNKASNFRFAPPEAQNAKLLKTIETQTKKLRFEQGLYTQIRASLWRSNDAGMDSLIFEAMNSKEQKKELCKAASSNLNGTESLFAREAFQEKIILPMIGRALSDLGSLGQKPEDLGVGGMNVLLSRSDWTGQEGSLQNSLMMCDLQQKYTRGDDRTQNFLTVGSFALGGAGAFLKVAKFATFLRPLTLQRLLSSSRVLMMASTFPSAPLSIIQVANACHGPSDSYSLQGMNCPLTSTGNIDMEKMVEVETIRLEKENCTLNTVLAGVELVPSVAGWLEKFKGARALTVTDYTPIRAPKIVKVSELRAVEEKAIKRLAELHVEVKPIDKLTTLEGNVKRWKSQTLDASEGVPEYYGKILKIEKLPPPGKATGPGTLALLHPEMESYRKRLESMGWDLVIDTSIKKTGAEAYIWKMTNVLALTPDSNWQTFVHEFQHVEFSRYIYPRFDKMQTAVKRGWSVKDILRLKTQKKLGPQKLQKLQGLLKEEIPLGALNETLSVDKELEVLGFKRFIPGVGSFARKYALRYQISQLEKWGTRSAVQEKTLLNAKAEYKRLELYEGVPTYAAAGGAVVAAGGIATKLTKRPEDYRQILYDKDGTLIAQTPEGEWELLE